MNLVELMLLDDQRVFLKYLSLVDMCFIPLACLNIQIM